MDKKQVKRIEDLTMAEIKLLERDKLCMNCGLWPCYATPPECYFWELEREKET